MQIKANDYILVAVLYIRLYGVRLKDTGTPAAQ